MSINFSKSEKATKNIKFRKIKNIDMESFKADILYSELYTNFNSDTLDIDTLCQTYDDTLNKLLDKHALQIEKSIRADTNAP